MEHSMQGDDPSRPTHPLSSFTSQGILPPSFSVGSIQTMSSKEAEDVLKVDQRNDDESTGRTNDDKRDDDIFGSFEDVSVAPKMERASFQRDEIRSQPSSLLSTIDRFRLNKNVLIDMSLPSLPGKTNTQVTKEATLYIGYLNLLTLFDMMDEDCDGFLKFEDLLFALISTKCPLFGSTRVLQRKLESAFDHIVVSKRPNAKGLILYREFPKLITEVCDREVNSIQIIMTYLNRFLQNDGIKRLRKRKASVARSESMTPHQDRMTPSNNPILREIIEELPQGAKRARRKERTFRRTLRDACGRMTMFHAFLGVLIWQFLFTCWYFFYPHTNFRFDQAFYYSAQAGLSVGFGMLSEEIKGGLSSDCQSMCKKQLNCTADEHVSLHDPLQLSQQESDPSRIMTILNVILGSSIIGGALGYFIQVMIDRHNELKEQIVNEEKRKALTFTHKKTVQDLKKIQTRRASVATRRRQRNVQYPCLAIIRANITYWCASCGLEINENFGDYMTVWTVLIFITCGVVFGMAHEKWGFIQSLYFAITTVSTGGLQGPDPTSRFSMVFTGCYVLVGVPLYAYCLGKYSEFLISFTQNENIRERVEEIVSLQEYQFLSKLHKSHHMTIGPFEFLQMELLRVGKCDQSFLDDVASRFDDFDILNNGSISLEELISANIFESYDVDDSGYLEYDEFRDMVLFMINGPWNKRFGRLIKTTISPGSRERDIKRVFHACDTSGDGKVSRHEFLDWICHLAVDQRVYWRGRVLWHKKNDRGIDDTRHYVAVLTDNGFEFRRGEAADAIFVDTDALPYAEVKQIRFDENCGVWITSREDSRRKGDIIALETQKQSVADKLVRACRRVRALDDKLYGTRLNMVCNDKDNDEDRHETKTSGMQALDIQAPPHDESTGCVTSTKARKRISLSIFQRLSQSLSSSTGSPNATSSSSPIQREGSSRSAFLSLFDEPE